MSQSVIALVASDANDSFVVARALEAKTLPRPVRLPSGEAAVLWLGANHCDVCVHDYQQPGMGGLETLIRIRPRHPDLPVVMVSNAHSEQAAVSAFQSGVANYLPKEPGFAEAVAASVQQILRTGVSSASFRPEPLGPDIDPRLLQPTYQNRLRMIGRQLDLNGYRSMNLLEVEGGFVVRVLGPGKRTAEALEFPDRDFPQSIRMALAGRGEGTREMTRTELLPTGYEDFLRALGYRLDEQLSEAVTVAELAGFMAVGGVGKVDDREQTTVVPFQWLMRPEDIAFMLDEAFCRRKAPADPPAKKGLRHGPPHGSPLISPGAMTPAAGWAGSSRSGHLHDYEKSRHPGRRGREDQAPRARRASWNSLGSSDKFLGPGPRRCSRVR